MPQRNNGLKGFIADVAIARAVRVKFKSGSTDEVEVTGAGEEGIGTTLNAAGADEHVTVILDNHSVEATASGTVTQGADLYAAASGAMGTTQSGRRQAIALEAASDGEKFEAMPCWAS